MRVAVLSLLGSVFVCASAFGQTAEFKCPAAGQIVEFSDGTRVTAQVAEANLCRLLVKQSGQDEFISNWYAPTMSLPASRSQAFAEQVKPWTLWPLTVGKKLTGRFDGVGSNPGFGGGTWYETVTVDAHEKLTTKAGVFDVFVVTRNEEAISHRYKSTFRQWYAPDLGMTVKFSFTDNQGAKRAGEAVAIRR